MADPNLKFARRTPAQLVFVARPFDKRILLLRILLGIGMMVLGLSWIRQFLFLASLFILIGLAVAIPMDLGQTLIFDKKQKLVYLHQHRFPFLFQPPLLSYALSDICDVRIHREAREGFSRAIETTTYQCQVLLDLKSDESVVIGSFTDDSPPGTEATDPRELAEKTVERVRKFLKLPNQKSY